jgi:hypothetical protein
MPRLVLQLHCDPQSGRRAVYADLFSDEDTVAFEHEQQHKELVDRLVNGGALKAAREGRVVVDRAEDMTPVFLAGG